jgi:chaperonin GroEL (HSP60 family)
MYQTVKAKTAAKKMTSNQTSLKKAILDTVGEASAVVGATMGPNGKVSLIERQENLPPFVTKDGITVFNSMAFADPTKQAILEAARDASAKTNTEAGDGPQPLWSKILTPDGFIQMSEVEVGMDICGTNETIQKVLGVYPKGQKEIIEVEFFDGRVVECCEDHLWTVTTNYGSNKALTTKEMMNDFLSTSSEGQNRYKYYTPRTKIEYKAKLRQFPLDPYLVGLLIGDGSLTGTGSVELSLGKNKEHILDKIKLPDGLFLKTYWVEKKNYYRVKIQGKTLDNKTIRDFVKEIGLDGSYSETKHIPSMYLLASKDDRVSLLRGLLDTDGYINDRERFEFSTVSDELAKDFIFLTRSLGVSLYCRVHHRKEGEGSYSQKSIHKITELKGDKYGDKIIHIRATGKFTDMQCIKVSNPDNLYITDNFIVTHNTTTATVLAESLIRLGFNYLEANPKLSTQKVMRELEVVHRDVISPFIKENSLKIKSDDGQDLLRKVSMIATNSDTEMTNAVVEAFDLVGHNGNVTISEDSGPSGYYVDKLNGFPIPRGFEDSCGRFLEEFINDKANYRTVLDKPRFILYNGQIKDVGVMMNVLNKIIGDSIPEDESQPSTASPNVVIMAHGFSDTMLAFFARNFKQEGTLNLLPLKTPLSPQANGQYHFLLDVSAFTGAKVFDPLTTPLQEAELDELGNKNMHYFEFYRYKALIVGDPDESTLFPRIEELEQQVKNHESIIDKEMINERMAILSGGIAKIKVIGSSESEIKEKKARVEDAVCAVKGALRSGVLPGGARTLLVLAKMILTGNYSKAVKRILGEAYQVPAKRILSNGGYNEDEIKEVLRQHDNNNDFFFTYDSLNEKYGDAVELGLIDSAEAVAMAIKNSLSVAKMLMGLSSVIVFQRDFEDEIDRAKKYDYQQETISAAQEREVQERYNDDRQ